MCQASSTHTFVGTHRSTRVHRYDQDVAPDNCPSNMPPTNLQHRRTHNLLLVSKLLHLRDNASPFTLVLDSLEQSGKALVREFIKRAKVKRDTPQHPWKTALMFEDALVSKVSNSIHILRNAAQTSRCRRIHQSAAQSPCRAAERDLVRKFTVAKYVNTSPHSSAIILNTRVQEPS